MQSKSWQFELAITNFPSDTLFVFYEASHASKELIVTYFIFTLFFKINSLAAKNLSSNRL